MEQGDLDFAFVDAIEKNSILSFDEVYQEKLVLCCTKKYMATIEDKDINKKNIQKMSFITYFDDARIVLGWLKQSFRMSNINLYVSVYSKDTQGVFACIKNSMGFGVVPLHMTVEDRDELIIINPKYGTYRNKISLAYVEEKLENPLLSVIHQSFIHKFSTMTII